MVEPILGILENMGILSPSCREAWHGEDKKRPAAVTLPVAVSFIALISRKQLLLAAVHFLQLQQVLDRKSVV